MTVLKHSKRDLVVRGMGGRTMPCCDLWICVSMDCLCVGCAFIQMDKNMVAKTTEGCCFEEEDRRVAQNTKSNSFGLFLLMVYFFLSFLLTLL